MKKLFLISFLALNIFFSCSDSSKELGSGYWLKIEGPTTNEILTHSKEMKGVPPSVLRYNYDNKFIIVEQKPNLYNDIINESEVIYNNGKDSLYYWLIIKDSTKVLGPMNKVQFEKAKNKYNVSDRLELKSVY